LTADVQGVLERFLPAPIRTLPVGESPAASGKFFYSGNTMFTTNICRVFAEASGRGFASNEEFLKFFQAAGFLPRRHMPSRDRRLTARRASARDRRCDWAVRREASDIPTRAVLRVHRGEVPRDTGRLSRAQLVQARQGQ
jgi:hypothetical protein